MMRTFPLQLKLTQPTDVATPLAKFIGTKHGPDAVKATQGTLKTLQDLRNSFDFVKSATQINNDFRLCAELQEQLVLYLKYITLIDNSFKSDFADPRGIKLIFPWGDSFQPTKKIRGMNTSKYEIAGILFNLITCYYIDGNMASTSVKDEDKLKALGKLRTCLWCLNELKQTLPSLLVNPQDIPSDLDITFINLLANYVNGLCYAVLLEIAQKDPNKYGPDRLASINKAASKNFQVALDILNATWKSSTIPENAKKALKATLIFTAAYHRTQAYYQQAQNHLILQKDEDRVREGHMGLATSHLRQALNVINSFLANKKDMELLSTQQTKELSALAQAIKEKYDEAAFKNKNIFQDLEYPPEQLPEIPDEKMVIGPVEPKEWKNKLEDEKNFDIFLSPELKAIKQEIHQIIDAKKADVETNLKSANNLRQKHYAEGYINYLIALDAGGVKKNELPPKIKAGVEKFHKNGGISNYEKIRDHIAQSSKYCKQILEQIKEAIAKEKADDEEMRKKFPQVWNRPHSEAINQENILNLRDLEQKYYIALKADEEVIFKYKKAQDWIIKLSQPQDQILLMLNPAADSEFYNQNKAKIEELQKYHDQINKLIDLETKREELKYLTEAFKKKNIVVELQQMAVMNPQDRQTAIQKLLTPLDAEFNKINQGIQDSYPILDQIVKSAKGMNENRSSTNQNAIKVLEDMSQAVILINEIFDDFTQGTEFYENLTYYLGLLQTTVTDFCIARDIDRQNRLQDLESKQQQFNVQKPYFTEENMKFAQGTSLFLPGNFLNKGTQQNQQPQQNQQSKPTVNVQSNMFGGPSQQMGIQQQGYPEGQQQFNQGQMGFQAGGYQGYQPQGFQQQPYQQQPYQQQPYQQQPSYQQQPTTQQQQQNKSDPFAGFGLVESTIVTNPKPKK